MEVIDWEVNCCRCYRAAGNAELAAQLEGLRACEDRALLAGHLVMLTTSDADKAQVRKPMPI